MKAFAALTKTETLLFLRNPTSLFMALLLPLALLLLQAFVIPGTMDPMSGGHSESPSLRLIDLFMPISIAIALTSVSITNYPSAVGAYRESGVLRRLDVTPIGAHRILFAQWVVSAASFAASVVLTGAVAGFAFGAVPPQNPALAVAVIVVGAFAMMAVGSLIAATAPNSQAAYGVGLLVFMGSLFTAGVWTPGPLMGEGIRAVVGYTPLGAMTQALTSAWYGGPARTEPFLVMAGWTLLCALVSAKVFRWR